MEQDVPGHYRQPKVKPIEEVLADVLERIATALEELVELEKTQPLEHVIYVEPKKEEKK